MTTIDPVATTSWPLAAPPRRAEAPPPGTFASVLAGRLQGTDASTWPTVTLAEMLGGHAPGGALAAGGAGGAPVAALAAAGWAPPVDGGSADPSGAAGRAAVEAAQRYLGVPYRWGGTDPATGLDCSGLVQRAFADLGISLPRVSADQARAGVAVPSLAEARPGDLVYWQGRGGRPNHIGIYLGDGQMLHAPRTGDVVRVAAVRSAPPDAIRRVW